MKRKITFTGLNASGFVRYADIKFPCREAKTVTVGNDPGELPKEWLERLENHPEFDIAEVKAPAARVTAPEAAAEKKDN